MSEAQKEGILDGVVCYLAGQIDFAKDHGKNIRQRIRDLAKQKNINISFIDPTQKIHGHTEEVGLAKANIDKLRREERYDELREFMKKVVRTDLRCVDVSDLLIVYLDPDIHTCGTYSELNVAIQQKKPVFVIIEGGKTKAPLWLFGIMHHEFIFSSEEECMDCLDKLNKGEKPISSRWVLFRKALKEMAKE